MNPKIKKFLFGSIPFIFVLIIMEGFVRLLNISAIQDEQYFFGFSGCPEYFQIIRTEDNRLIYHTNPFKDIEKASFNVNKKKNEFRIFALGGSATFGEPYGPEGAFSYWLEERLSMMDSTREYNVINCGRRGFGSVRVKTIFDEVIQYAPDLIVVYFGNNEGRDDYFHRREINIEIRPHLKMMKRMLDQSYIFRILFHLFIKKSVTSYGAGTLRDILAYDSFDKDNFFEKIKTVTEIRQAMDREHGGSWVSESDITTLSELDIRDSKALSKLNRRNIWHDKIKGVYAGVVRQMIRESKIQNIPIIFLTRARNFYYNKDSRILFENFNDGNNALREVCHEGSTPLVETVPALLAVFDEEIGYNAFMDEVHPTLLTNQTLAKEITKKMLQLQLIGGSFSEDTAKFEARIETQEQKKRTLFRLNSQCYSLLGWQTLVRLNRDRDQKFEKKQIVMLAKKAIDLNPDNLEAYLLLGTFYSLEQDHTNSEKIWKKMKLQLGRKM